MYSDIYTDPAHNPTDMQMHTEVQTQAKTNMYTKTTRDIQHMQTENT